MTTEAQFLNQVRSLARILGWFTYHPQLSKWSERGFPDITMVRGNRLVFAELKNEKGKTTVFQDEWLERLGQTGVEVYLWRPADLEAIAEILR